MRTFFAWLIACSPLLAADPKTDAEAALALAIAQRQPVVSRQTVFTEESKARAEAIRSGKPLVIRYGSLDCSAVCRSVDAVVCHLDQESPRIRLAVYQAGDSPYWWYLDWERVPTIGEIEEAAKLLRSKIVGAKAKIDWQF